MNTVFSTHLFRHGPMRVFAALGGLTLSVGCALTGLMVGQKLFFSNALDIQLYHRPLFLFGILLVVVGMQIIGFGLVGEFILRARLRRQGQ